MTLLKQLPLIFVLVACATSNKSVQELKQAPTATTSEIKNGGKLFSIHCVVCHNEDAAGGIGPNLTDNYWIQGSSYQAIFSTIEIGTENGMPNYASILTSDQIKHLTLFIQQLKPTEGKDPQGKKTTSK